MNTDIMASVKPEVPVLERNHPFTKTRPSPTSTLSTTSASSSSPSAIPLRSQILPLSSSCLGVRVSDRSWELVSKIILAGIKPDIRGPSMVTDGLIGLMGGFVLAYQNSAGRLMGFFPNNAEVARCKKW